MQDSPFTLIDAVLTVYIYNARGELEYTEVGLKTDPSTPPSAPDTSGEHRISRVERSVTTYSDGATYDVLMTRNSEWTTANSAASIITSAVYTRLDGLMEWSVAYPGQTYQQVTKSVTQPGSTRTLTQTYPDGSSQVSLFSYGRLSTVTRYDASTPSPVQIAKTTYAYDPHGRIQTTTGGENLVGAGVGLIASGFVGLLECRAYAKENDIPQSEAEATSRWTEVLEAGFRESGSIDKGFGGFMRNDFTGALEPLSQSAGNRLFNEYMNVPNQVFLFHWDSDSGKLTIRATGP